MYDSDLTTTTSPLTSLAPYSGQRPVKNTNLQTEFLLQIQKQWEDSAILLTSNRPQHKDKTKDRPTQRKKQNFKGKDSREQKQNKWAYKKLPI
jgi:hypothetical protein